MSNSLNGLNLHHFIHIQLNSLFLIFLTETISRNNNCLKTCYKSEYLQIIFFPSHNLSSFPLCPFDSPIFFLLHILFCLFIFLWFLTFFVLFLIVIISLELTRAKYIFNKCGTNIYFFYSTEVWSITMTEL